MIFSQCKLCGPPFDAHKLCVLAPSGVVYIQALKKIPTRLHHLQLNSISQQAMTNPGSEDS